MVHIDKEKQDELTILNNAIALFEEMKLNSSPDVVLACWFYDNQDLIDQTILELQFLVDTIDD